MLLILGVIVHVTAVAQCIKGTVKGDSDKEPLIGVLVKIKDIKRSTVTDTDGRYVFDNLKQGVYKIIFRHIGMGTVEKEVTIKDNETVTLDITMEDNLQLGSVEVIGVGDRKSIRDVKQKGVPVSIIDGREIAGRGTSIEEVINHQTGVKIRQTGGAGSQTKINVRGLEGNRVQIYMDGYPLNTPDGNFSIDDVPLQFIDRIEIYKGIVPPEFGGDGLGSAINIVTIDIDQDYVDAAYKIQSYGVHDASVTGRHYFPKLHTAMSLYLGGTLAENDYTMMSPFIEGLKIKRDHDGLKQATYALSFDFMDTYFDKASLEIFGLNNRKEMQGIDTNIRYTYTKANSLGGSFNFEKNGFLTKGLKLKLDAKYIYITSCLNDTSSYVFDFEGNKRPNSFRGEVGSVPNFSDDKTHDIRYNLNLSYDLIPNKMNINLNNDFRYVIQEANDTVADNFLKKDLSGLKAHVKGMITSLALQNKWFGGRLTSILTGRHYYYGISGKTVDLTYGSESEPVTSERTGNYFGYSLALKYDLAKNLFLKAAFEHNYRLPRYEEVLGDRVKTMTNVGLNPEQADNYNVGIYYDHYYNQTSRLQFEANTYMMNVKDMMYLLSQAGYLKYQNLGKALLYGVDAEIKWDINRNWFVSLNGTWQKSLDHSKYIYGTHTPSMTYKMELPHIPVLYFNWMADYRKDNLFGGKGQYTRFYYEGGYTDKYYYGFELSKNQDFKIPSTHIHTLGMEYGFMNRKIIIGLECHNILDADEMTNFNFPLAGRTIAAKIRFTTLKW